ncbi:MAG: immunoglobulin-like domain-containing protein [Candidatus Izemoplasmataceae bacterium]
MFKKFALFLLIAMSIFSLAACRRTTDPDPNGEMTVQEKLEDAAGRVLFVDTGAVDRNLTFPTSLVHGVTVSWSSSNTAVISNTGQVTRPDSGADNATVTVTATFSLEGETLTRTYTFTVVALPESNAYTDFALLHSENSLNAAIEAEGIVVSVFEAGYFLYDGTNFISVYAPNHDTVSLGDRVRVLGSYGRYHTLWQVTSVTSEIVVSSGHDTTVPVTEASVADIWALDSSANRLINGRTFKVQGTVELRGSFDNVYIVDGDDALLVYYLSNESSIEALESFVGQVIELEVIYYTNHDRDGVMVVFQGGVDDITVIELDDADALATDIAALRPTPNYTFGGNITLPATGANGTSFTGWTSSHPAYIANDGSFVAMPSTPTEVTFTATATLGELTQEVTVKVDALAPMSISDAIDVAAGKHVYVEGIVTYVVQANRGFFIYDGTGHLYIRDTDLVPSSGAVPYNVGDVVKFVGARDNFAGIPQITAIKLHETTTNTFDMPTNQGLVSIESIGAGTHPAGTIVTITGVATTVVDGTFTNYRIVDGDHFVQVHHNTDNTVFADFDGQLVTVEVFVFQWAHANKFVGFFGTADDVSVGELSDEAKADLAVAAIDLGDLSAIFDNITLPTTGLYDSTITWSSSNETVISNTGVVTRQETEQTVTLTATVTVGVEVSTREFVVTVLDEEYVPTGMTVSQALEAEVGTIIYVEGIVTSYSPFSKRIFIQDTDGTAMYVNVQLSDHVSIGDRVVLRGTLQNYTGFGNDFLQLSSDTTLVMNYEGDHAVTVITDATWTEIVDGHKAFENVGTRYRMEDVAITKFDGSWIYLTTGEDMDLRFNVGSYGGHLSALYAAEGVIPWVEFTLYDLYQGDIRVEAVVFPDLTNAQVAILADARLSLPATTETDLVLPATLSIAGVDYDRGPDVFALVWTSANTDVITDAGVVTRPAIGEPDVEVQMTATITFADESTYAVNFMVTVLAEEEVVVGAVTVTAEYPGGTTTNMAAEPENNAATIGLDEDLFTVLSIKNVPSNQIGLNTAGQIRIYADRATGDGNTLSISIAEGYTITKVEFVFGASTNNPTAELILGTTEYSLVNTDLTNTTLTYDELDITTFTLQNTDNAGTSNAQIYILQIKITYVEDSVE